MACIILLMLGCDAGRNATSSARQPIDTSKQTYESVSGRKPEHESTADNHHDLKQYMFSQIHMAMPVRITVWSDSERQAKRAARSSFERMESIVGALNHYDPRSTLNQLCRAKFSKNEPVSPDLLNVLLFAKMMFERTEGAFDPTAGAIIQLWKTARSTKKVPSQLEIKTALRRVRFEHLEIDPATDRVQCTYNHPTGDLKLDFGGVAKGYVIDEGLRTAQNAGAQRICIEAGGDFVLGDAPPGKPGWDINVPRLGTKTVANCSISISGDTVQFAEIDSARYSHVIDPRTGIALSNRNMSVVIAKSAMESDALATTACIMSEEAFAAVVENFDDVQYWRWSLAQNDQ